MQQLLESEKTFLKNHKALDKYSKLSQELTNFTKNDILWSIYDDLKNNYLMNNDFFNCFLTYKQMANQLYEEKKFEQAIQFLILALYVRIYEIGQECIESGFSSDMMYERHLSKYHKDLKKYMKKANIKISDTDSMCDLVGKIINIYIPNLSDDFWIYWLSFKYIDYIS